MTHTPDDLLDALRARRDEQRERMDAAFHACAGIPTDKLTPGVVKRLIEALEGLMCDGSDQYVDQCGAILRELGSE